MHKDVGDPGPSHIANGKVKWCSQLKRTVGKFLEKLNVELLYNPIMVLLVYTREK